MTDPANPPERYTSYHSEKTFSILNEDRMDVKPEHRVFEYNGIAYGISANGGELATYGPPLKYVMPWGIGEEERKVLATFPPTDFATFISTYEIEGRTLEWILEHQREWKYKLTADHFERVLTGFSFSFVYRKTPCYIYYCGEHGKPRQTDGRYLRILMGMPYDVTQYAPFTPGVEHWANHMPGYYGKEPETHEIIIGPFQTVGALLDTVQFDGKTLREIFDTEYDDGEVLCGVFEG